MKTRVALLLLVLALLAPTLTSAIAWSVEKYWTPGGGPAYRYDADGNKIGNRYFTGCLRPGFYVLRDGRMFYRAARCKTGKSLGYWLRWGTWAGDVRY